MFFDTVTDKELYNQTMAALKRENHEFCKLQNSKEYRQGRYLKRIRENIFKPTQLLKKIKATVRADKIKRLYPRTSIESTLDHSPNYYSKERIAIYTAIFGNYDSILEPGWVPDNCDYYIITDQDVPSESAWKKIDIDLIALQVEGDSNKNRYCKMFPHLLPIICNYNISIYIDGNIKPISDFTEFANLLTGIGMAFHRHSSRNCVYNEGIACIISGKESKSTVDEHLSFLKKEGFPENYGMLECNMIVRNHSSIVMKKIMEEWWQVFQVHSKRDQLSLPYVLYKNSIEVSSVALLGDNIYENYALRVVKHD